MNSSIARYLLAIPLALLTFSPQVPAKETRTVTAIRPGEVWPDTEGNPINAHGGGILFHQGTYYWYGEIKQGETYTPKENASWGGTRIDIVGVGCYSSTDLLNWKNCGNILPSVPGGDLDPKKVLERPKCIYNAKTKKFVLWFHSDSLDYAAARSGVATADSPTGPFTYLGSFRPNAGQWPINITPEQKIEKSSKLVRDFADGQMTRDLTVFVDDDQKAYLIAASEANPTLQISELTDDYLKTTGKFTRAFIGRSMEAPAVFKRQGKYYLIASGCTGWDPNAARSAVADSIWGPWTELGNPCVGDKSDITFQSQSTYVLPVVGKPDTFVFLADRWVKNNLSDSRYIWLPITFTPAGKPEINWLDEWKP